MRRSSLQQEGNLEEAVLVCEDLLDAGVDRSDVHYFLGWLYQESDRWDEAAAQFELLLDDPDYALSCFYALGQCSRALGNLEEAAHYFDEAVDRVNLDALTLEEVDQLLQLCQEAAEAHREMSDLEGARDRLLGAAGLPAEPGMARPGHGSRADDARGPGDNPTAAAATAQHGWRWHRRERFRSVAAAERDIPDSPC